MRSLRRVAGLVGLAILSACGTAQEAAAGKRYRAWCAADSRPLGPWRETRAAAEADRAAHLKQFGGWHAARIDTAG